MSDLRTLKAALEEIGAPENIFSLRGFKEGAYCIEVRSGVWYVYAVDRGEHLDETTFASEAAACQLLFEWVRREMSIPKRYVPRRGSGA